MERIDVVEAGIEQLRRALDGGEVTSVGLVHEYLRRIGGYDRHGLRLNAIPVLDPGAFAAARASDERRAAGELLGPLDGIPYTAKDSYLARGLPVAAGSPAFARLIAQHDAFAVERLRAGGAVLLGLTNMPPMANGGMQRGVYGRAESPYNPDYLAAAYVSGSSNGSGVSTATSMAAFGLGEETWSSGRAPASNNALVAYTPSRGVISTRGNWPLTPTMDVVVPQTRTVADLLEVLDLLVVDDPETRGDFWRSQPWIALPRPSELRPERFARLRDDGALRGVRLGVPRMYIGRDAGADVPIETHPDVLALWERARRALEGLGAEVVECDFPAVSNYERDRPGARTPVERGLWPEEYLREEVHDLQAWGFDDFLRANGDPGLHRLVDADGPRIYPVPTGTEADVLEVYDPVYDIDMAEYVEIARRGLPERLEDFAHLEAGARGLEAARRIDLEEWMTAQGLDALVFPAAADVSREDAERDHDEHRKAWTNGVGVSNGGLVPRHYGIPTATVPMGRMASTGMPVGLTFAGRAYDDWRLIAFAGAFETGTSLRAAPERTPALTGEPGSGPIPTGTRPGGGALAAAPTLDVALRLVGDGSDVDEHGRAPAVEVRVRSDAERVEVAVDGALVPLERTADGWIGRHAIAADQHAHRHSEWREPYGSLVSVIGSRAGAGQAGWFGAVGGIL